MSKRKAFSQTRNRLSAALIAAMILPATGAAFAQDAGTGTDETQQQPATQESKDESPSQPRRDAGEGRRNDSRRDAGDGRRERAAK